MKVTTGLPFISDLPVNENLAWQMSRAEKYCLRDLLNHLKVDYAIEIGTYQGGSLQVLSSYCQNVISIDISAEPKRTLEDQFPNVEFVVGTSAEVLTDQFKKIYDQGRQLNFVLVDGDHTRKGVNRDLRLILDYPHPYPLTIICHDSFNPQCRKGIKQIDYVNHPKVTYVEIDYICGAFWANNNYRQMTGGFAMIRLGEKDPNKKIVVNESYKNLFHTAYWHSLHPWKDPLLFLSPLKRKIFRLLGKKHKTDRYFNFESKN